MTYAHGYIKIPWYIMMKIYEYSLPWVNVCLLMCVDCRLKIHTYICIILIATWFEEDKVFGSLVYQRDVTCALRHPFNWSVSSLLKRLIQTNNKASWLRISAPFSPLTKGFPSQRVGDKDIVLLSGHHVVSFKASIFKQIYISQHNFCWYLHFRSGVKYIDGRLITTKQYCACNTKKNACHMNLKWAHCLYLECNCCVEVK